MSGESFDIFDEGANPLDGVEDIIVSLHDWRFSRPHEDELQVEVTGRRGVYAMVFMWQEEYDSLQVYCHFDFDIPEENLHHAAMALMAVNANMWLGHFDIPGDTRTPCFRHTCLLSPPVRGQGIEQVEELIDIALSECDRYYSAFHMLSTPSCQDETSLAFALMDTAGES